MELGQILDRLSDVLGIKNEGDLARLFKLTPSALSWRKKNNSIPYKELIELCIEKGLNFRWVITGYGSRFMPVNEIEETEFLNYVDTVSKYHHKFKEHILIFCKLLEHLRHEERWNSLLYEVMLAIEDLVASLDEKKSR